MTPLRAGGLHLGGIDDHGEVRMPLRILIVEDDPGQAELMRSLLKESFDGARTIIAVASSGSEAVALPIIEHDVVLLDLNLPDVQGQATFDLVHTKAPFVPVILVSGVNDETLAESLLRGGAQDYLLKGQFTASALKRAIRYAVERQNLVIQLAHVRDDLALAEAALAKTPVASMTWSYNGRTFILNSFNDAATTLLPADRAPRLGMTTDDYLGHESVIAAAIERTHRTGEAMQLMAVVPRSGPAEDVVVTCASLPPNLVVVSFDVSIEKETAQTGRLAEEMRLRAVFDNNPVPGFLWRIVDDDFECTASNPAALAIHEAARELVGRRAARVFEDQPELLIAMRRVVRSGGTESLMVESRAFTVPARPVSVTVADVRPDRLLLYVQDASIGTTRDTVERSERNYRSLLEAAPVGITITDLHGRIRHANSTMASMLGYTTDELNGMSISDLLYPSDLAQDPPRLDLVRAHGSLRRERVLRAKNGRPVITEISAVAIDDDRVLGTARDLTELRKSEEQAAFQANLLAHVQDAVIATDLTGRVVYWNHRAEELYQWRSEEATGRLLTELNTPPEFIDAAELARNSVLDTGHWEGEFTCTRKDGQRIPIFASLSATYDSAGKRSGFVSVSYDRSELMKAEAARAQNELLLGAILENLPVGVWMIDKSGTIIGSNPEARKIWGGARYETLQETSYKAWWAGTGRAVSTTERPSYVTLTTQQPVRDVEMEIEGFDGAHRWIILSSVPVVSASGEFLGVVVVDLDVTEKRVAQEAMRRSEASFRSLIENSSDIISILSQSGVMLYQSPSIEPILGYRPEEVLGKSAFSYLRPEDIERAGAHITRQLKNKTPMLIELDFLHLNGTWRSLEVVTSRARFGRDVQIIANARDVTERNAMARSLEQAKRIGGLGRLAATIAHEINNILMAIQPFAEVVRRKANGQADLERAAAQILRAVQRGRTVTGEILRFARPAEPHLTPMSLRNLLHSLEHEFRALLPDSIVLHVDLPSDDLSIRVDRDQMAQVLTNLLLNARDASPSGGVIRIAAKNIDDATVGIVVSDTGEGMPAELLGQIFEPLFTTKQRGTGIGLSVVHQIVTRHGGKIDVESLPGRGSTFTIAIPHASMSPPARPG